ncbi:hypothetical protein ACFQS2_01380 [Brachybacterium sp. GCM10030267]|uniref:hypothetical protein n=1 Tax=Brachybacterium sp. GCM10030267 TaxID=3273381 RepID=UPI0036090EE1
MSLTALLPRAITVLEDAPRRAEELTGGEATHRALGRFVRDSVVAEHAPPLAAWRDGREAGAEDRSVSHCLVALAHLHALQSPDGTFRSGDNVASPPDTAFTVNDLAASLAMIRGDDATPALAPLIEPLTALLRGAAPALATGGVHTPNHRWEISAALVRLGRLLGDAACTARARQWLAEGVDLQPDGLFSERSPNYAAHVSVPSLMAIGRHLDDPRPRQEALDGLRTQARLTDADGLVESLASRRQDQFAPFDGGALFPWFHSAAALFDDRLCARAAARTADRADGRTVLELLAIGVEEPGALGERPEPLPDPRPSAPELTHLETSRLLQIDHGTSRTVLFAGTDTAREDRISSGISSNPTFGRFSGRRVGLTDMRLSRDFFNLGPARFTEISPAREQGGILTLEMQETVHGEYFHPLPVSAQQSQGDYAMEFNGRFSAAMSFSQRLRELVTLTTEASVRVGADQLSLKLTIDGPLAAHCLALRFTGGTFAGTRQDERGRRVPETLNAIDDSAGDHVATVTYTGEHESFELTARGDLQGAAFYHPGETYTFLGGSDELTGDVLYVAMTSRQPLHLELTRRAIGR